MSNRLPGIVCTFFLVASLALAPAPALAVIAKPTPLKAIFADATHIAAAKVESVEPDRPAMKLMLTDDLKGAAGDREILINLTGNPTGAQPSGPRDVTDRVAAGMQAVVFFVEGGAPFALVFIEGSWYRIAKSGGKAWPYLYGEFYLRRTFKGGSAELKQAVLDIKAGKEGPDLDPSAEPGLGAALPGVTAAPLNIAAGVKDAAKDGGGKDGAAKATSGATKTKDAKPASGGSAKPQEKGDGSLFKIVGGIVIAAGVALLVYVFAIRKK